MLKLAKTPKVVSLQILARVANPATVPSQANLAKAANLAKVANLARVEIVDLEVSSHIRDEVISQK